MPKIIIDVPDETYQKIMRDRHSRTLQLWESIIAGGTVQEKAQEKTDSKETVAKLDKIRAEIEKIIQKEIVIDSSGGEYEKTISKLDPDDVFEIIDKYKAESEVKIEL